MIKSPIYDDNYVKKLVKIPQFTLKAHTIIFLYFYNFGFLYKEKFPVRALNMDTANTKYKFTSYVISSLLAGQRLS